jgi:hypothetical protein
MPSRKENYLAPVVTGLRNLVAIPTELARLLNIFAVNPSYLKAISSIRLLRRDKRLMNMECQCSTVSERLAVGLGAVT